jgi:hypothetical protein
MVKCRIETRGPADEEIFIIVGSVQALAVGVKQYKATEDEKELDE